MGEIGQGQSLGRDKESTMLELKLRKEFQGRRLKGTAIELTNKNKTGATQVPASDFLEITYPSGDVLKALEACEPKQSRPVILIGERGQGKSHLMAVMYHALTDSSSTTSWLQQWGERLGNTKISGIKIRDGFHVISDSLHRHNFKFLWDMVFDNHPNGDYVRGKWEALGDKKPDVPGYDLLLDLFQKQPTAIILDEFQTWYDGLTDTKKAPHQKRAFNFIQILSEIAKEHPELLVLVVSVRNGNTDAFQQIQRVNPTLVDFKGPNAKRDRQRLLLHRLFENRMQVSSADIASLILAHTTEYFRLREIPPAEQDAMSRDFTEAWPFAPHLMQLLEDQVLVATHAQETRDLIRILADLFKRSQQTATIVTAADFSLDDEDCGITSLLDSVANQHHTNLREKAQRNLLAVRDAVADVDSRVPHLSEIIGSLWLRSLAVGNQAGAEPSTLHVDITRDTVIDDNSFQDELTAIVENSFNIHEDGERLVFREEENPQAKLMASARNNKLFKDEEDLEQLSLEVRYVIGGADDVPRAFRIIVLRSTWLTDPWAAVDDNDHPDNWDDRIPLIVLPEVPDKIDQRLGLWLKQHLQKRRNAVRFLIPREASDPIYTDRDLIILSRAVLLAGKWKDQSPEYKRLQSRYEKDLRATLKIRFDRFAIVDTWDFQHPEKCRFHLEGHNTQGNKIPEAIDERIRTDLFIPEDFSAILLDAAKNNETVGKLLKEFQEPRPNCLGCIPWLGETLMKERIVRMCSRGLIAINLRGMEYLQVKPDEDEESAWRRMRGKIGTGKHLDETYILETQSVPQSQSKQTNTNLPLGEEPVIDRDGVDKNKDNDTGTDDKEAGLGIFDEGQKLSLYSSGATSPLNLLGKLESWNIQSGTQLRYLTLKTDKLTGSQLNKMLRDLPDGITYELDVQKEED